MSFKNICLLSLVSFSSSASVARRSAVSPACIEFRQKIEIQIENDLISNRKPEWTIGPHEIPEKLGCKAVDYDQTFCTRSCELSTGDQCTPGIHTEGTDRCGLNLDCVLTGLTYTCQPPTDYADLSSLSSDYLYSWLNSELGIALLPDDYSYSDSAFP